MDLITYHGSMVSKMILSQEVNQDIRVNDIEKYAYDSMQNNIVQNQTKSTFLFFSVFQE